MDDSLPHSKAGERYLLPPDPSGLWRTPSNPEDFYSPLEEKSGIYFGEISCTEESRDTWEATEDEELVVASALDSTNRDQAQEPHSIASLSVEHRASPVKGTPTMTTGNIAAPLHDDKRARTTAPDPALNSSSTSRPDRQSSMDGSHGHRNLQPDFSIPDLDIAFFESDFYKRFHTQSTSA